MAEFLVVTQRNYADYSPDDFAHHLAGEVDRARQLYEERWFRAIWTRGDGAGVVILMEAADAGEARRVWRTLPLAAKGMIDATIIPLTAYHGFCPTMRPAPQPAGTGQGDGS